MILCHCAGVTEAEVIRTVLDGASTVEDVGRRCGAGTCCGPCQDEIGDLICRLRSRPIGVEVTSDREGTAA